MSQLPPSLVGAVVERAVHSRPSYPPATTPPSTGFPSVQHRSRSAFARARDLKRNGNQLSGEPRPTGPPVIKRSGVFTSDKKEEVSSAGSGRKSERGNRGQTGSIGAFGCSISNIRDLTCLWFQKSNYPQVSLWILPRIASTYHNRTS